MTGRQRMAAMLALWTACAVLAAVVTHVWVTRPDTFATGMPQGVGVGSGPAIAIDSIAVGSALPPGIDLADLGLADSTDLPFGLEAPVELARRDPPAEVRNCRQYLAWAQHEGAVPIGPYPVHALTLTAGRSVGVEVRAVAVVQARTRPEQPSTRSVEVTCGSGVPTPSTTSVAEQDLPQVGVSAPGFNLPVEDEEYVYYLNHRDFGGTEHGLAAGQTIELNFVVGTPNGSGRFEYDIQVRLIIDGKPEVRTITNGSRRFSCCGRVTYTGFHTATYVWTMSPQRTLKICPQQTYTGDPPPRTCDPPQPR